MNVLESEVENHFCWLVEMAGGKSWKFASPSQRGVADRIVCMPNGTTHFVELKTKGGRLSALQLIFHAEMERLRQSHPVIWSKEQAEDWIEQMKAKQR